MPKPSRCKFGFAVVKLPLVFATAKKKKRECVAAMYTFLAANTICIFLVANTVCKRTLYSDNYLQLHLSNCGSDRQRYYMARSDSLQSQETDHSHPLPSAACTLKMPMAGLTYHRNQFRSHDHPHHLLKNVRIVFLRYLFNGLINFPTSA